MKKTMLLSVLAIPFSINAIAQKLNDVKVDLIARQIPGAKAKIDAMGNDPKNQKLAEYWYLKGSVYDSIAYNPAYAALEADPKNVSFESYKKVLELNPKFENLKNGSYKEFFILDRSYYSDAIANFNAKKYCEAAASFKASEKVSNYIASKGWLLMYTNDAGKPDTLRGETFNQDLIFNTAVSYNQCGKKDETIATYMRLIERKATGENYANGVYGFTIEHLLSKDDVAGAERVAKLAKEAMPTEDIFDDIATNYYRKKKDYAKLFEAYENSIKIVPNNQRIWRNYAIEASAYMYYNPDAAKSSELPADYEARSAKALDIITKGSAATSNYAYFDYSLGNYYNNLANDFMDKMRRIRATLDPKTKKVIPMKPAQIKERDGYKAKADALFDKSTTSLIAAEKKYVAMNGTYKDDYEKKDYGACLNLLSTIYSYRGNVAKAKEYDDKYRKLTAR
jgi:hypothetical protein